MLFHNFSPCFAQSLQILVTSRSHRFLLLLLKERNYDLKNSRQRWTINLWFDQIKRRVYCKLLWDGFLEKRKSWNVWNFTIFLWLCQRRVSHCQSNPFSTRGRMLWLGFFPLLTPGFAPCLWWDIRFLQLLFLTKKLFLIRKFPLGWQIQRGWETHEICIKADGIFKSLPSHCRVTNWHCSTHWNCLKNTLQQFLQIFTPYISKLWKGQRVIFLSSIEKCQD